MPPRLRGAIIGCGYFGQSQLAAWRRMAGVEIVAASDLGADRSRAAAPPATSAAEMLDREQLEFVDIATRPTSHLELVRLTLGRGTPTICQKPTAALQTASLSQGATA
jgi:predicted dehydrogenase